LFVKFEALVAFVIHLAAHIAPLAAIIQTHILTSDNASVADTSMAASILSSQISKISFMLALRSANHDISAYNQVYDSVSPPLTGILSICALISTCFNKFITEKSTFNSI
jgi:hypothetical protein